MPFFFIQNKAVFSSYSNMSKAMLNHPLFIWNNEVFHISHAPYFSLCNYHNFEKILSIPITNRIDLNTDSRQKYCIFNGKKKLFDQEQITKITKNNITESQKFFFQLLEDQQKLYQELSLIQGKYKFLLDNKIKSSQLDEILSEKLKKAKAIEIAKYMDTNSQEYLHDPALHNHMLFLENNNFV